MCCSGLAMVTPAGGYVPSHGFALAALAQIHDHRLVVFAGEHDALDVQQDLGDVFLDTRQSGELMQGTGNTHGGHGSTRDRAQQRATQRVAERVAEARLERLDGEAGALRIQNSSVRVGRCAISTVVILSAELGGASPRQRGFG